MILLAFAIIFIYKDWQRIRLRSNYEIVKGRSLGIKAEFAAIVDCIILLRLKERCMAEPRVSIFAENVNNVSLLVMRF